MVLKYRVKELKFSSKLSMLGYGREASRFYSSYDLPHVLHASEDVVVVQLFVCPYQDVYHAEDEGD